MGQTQCNPANCCGGDELEEENRPKPSKPTPKNQTKPSIEEWKKFGSTLNDGHILLPTDDESTKFEEASRTYWQFVNDIIPSVIVVCLSEDDVVKTMKFISNHKSITFRIKCGGHQRVVLTKQQVEL